MKKPDWSQDFLKKLLKYSETPENQTIEHFLENAHKPLPFYSILDDYGYYHKSLSDTESLHFLQDMQYDSFLSYITDNGMSDYHSSIEQLLLDDDLQLYIKAWEKLQLDFGIEKITCKEFDTLEAKHSFYWIKIDEKYKDTKIYHWVCNQAAIHLKKDAKAFDCVSFHQFIHILNNDKDYEKLFLTDDFFIPIMVEKIYSLSMDCEDVQTIISRYSHHFSESIVEKIILTLLSKQDNMSFLFRYIFDFCYHLENNCKIAYTDLILQLFKSIKDKKSYNMDLCHALKMQKNENILYIRNDLMNINYFGIEPTLLVFKNYLNSIVKNFNLYDGKAFGGITFHHMFPIQEFTSTVDFISTHFPEFEKSISAQEILNMVCILLKMNEYHESIFNLCQRLNHIDILFIINRLDKKEYENTIIVLEKICLKKKLDEQLFISSNTQSRQKL